MQDYQKRVVEEREEVSKRHGALLIFRHSEKFSDVAIDEQERLSHQITVMAEYISILDERILAFTQN